MMVVVVDTQKPLYIKGGCIQLPYNRACLAFSIGHYLHSCTHVVALSPVFTVLYVNLQLQQRT